MPKEKPSEETIPDGCEDEYLLALVRSDKCKCQKPKQPFSSFCRTCYFKLPFELSQELWVTWKDGYGEVYDQCIEYLELAK